MKEAEQFVKFHSREISSDSFLPENKCFALKKVMVIEI